MHAATDLVALELAVSVCQADRARLSAMPLDALAEAVHIARSIGNLCTALDLMQPGLGMRLHTALYVQVHEVAMPADYDLFAAPCSAGVAADAPVLQ